MNHARQCRMTSGLALASVAVLFLAGCPKSQPPQAAPTLEPSQILRQAPVGRFQTVGPTNKIALDTKTGILCRTFDWENPEGFPMCVELLMDEYRTVNKLRAAAYAGEQLKDHGVTLFAPKQKK
jgi:hypothetical protein